MLIISKDTIGKNFVQVEPGELIRGHYQYLSYFNGEWIMSTYSKSEGYTNPEAKQNYRKPKNIYGWIEIMPKLIDKYWNKFYKFLLGEV